MERKIFGQGSRFGSAKERVLRMFRLINGSGKEDSNASSIASAHGRGIRQPNTINPQAYIIANQRMHQIETQKAMAISISRHDRWKAGGPV